MARSVRSVGRSLGAGLLALVVVTGCDASGDPEGTASPSVSSASPSASPSPSPTPSASPSGPEVPAAARKQTPAGAEAFLRYYFDELNRVSMVPDPGVLGSLGTSDCEFCQRNETTIKSLADAGHRYVTEPTRVTAAEAFGGAPKDAQYVHLEFDQLGAKIVDEAGTKVGEDKKLEAKANAALRWQGGSWKLQGVERG